MLSFTKDVAAKLNPIIEKLSGWLASFIKVEPANIHGGIVLALSIWLAYIVSGKRLGIGTLALGGLIFAGLHWLGL